MRVMSPVVSKSFSGEGLRFKNEDSRKVTQVRSILH